MSPCKKCEAKCCRYFALQIDTPRSKQDFENIRWFIAHKGVSVYVEKKKWFLQISSNCHYLTKTHMCRIYDKRPLICREHDIYSCEHVAAGGFEHDLEFKTLKQFDAYLAERFKKKTKKPHRNHRDKERCPLVEADDHGELIADVTADHVDRGMGEVQNPEDGQKECKPQSHQNIYG